MSAYIIIDLTIHGQEKLVPYQKLAPATIDSYNGKFIVRGGQITLLEGEWKSDRIVVIEFPSVERAKEWWNSEMYSEAKKIRQSAASTKMIVVEGV